jgi:ATP-dependent helicase/nuclease subunit A
MTDLPLPFEDEPQASALLDARDREGRERAVDPRFNVALEASAGTGKTRVLVDRYINLLRAGVDPSEILALTFTRKAAAEMRDRIVATLRNAAAKGEIPPARWRELRDRTADVAISTIDAFCLSLLREFPLEADLDPGFQMADETEVPRLVDEALDRALRICREVAREDEHVALVFAQLGDRRARAGLSVLLGRRIVAPAVLTRYLSLGPPDLTVNEAARRGAAALAGVFVSMRGGLDRFLDTGPLDAKFSLFARELRRLDASIEAGAVEPSRVHAAFVHAREHFLTQDGEPRKVLPKRYGTSAFASASDRHAHRDFVVAHARAIAEAYAAYRRDLNVLVSKGVWRMFMIAQAEYRRTLDARAALDFPDLLLTSLDLLRQMEEFAQSRFRLESRYHHVLVDEFQDTNRAQWELVSLLIQSWGEGAGLAHTGTLPPSIFIVGDRKQSIYAFRDADVSLFREASRYMSGLRPGGDVRRSISRSFRSVPPLLGFVNDLCAAIAKSPDRRDAFAYDEQDRFPVDAVPEPAGDSVSLIEGDTLESCARTTAAEIDHLIADGALVRDRDTGVRRPVRAGDVAILFRTRESHREYEAALEERGISAYVYKGLGFFEADEIQDVLALLRHLADPASDLSAAAWLRSRFIRMSDEGLRRLGPHLADALSSTALPATALEASDSEALLMARRASARWCSLADRLPPAELLDRAIQETAYMAELRGQRFQQGRENLKKIRADIRRIQNRGYATLERIVTHLERLAVGDEANAVIDAGDAVSLMTVHAAKGLEFPVVFVVNLARGTGNRRAAIRVAVESDRDVSVAVGDFESPADEDETARDREESKRLLYVALTRARDRLYLGSVLKDGRFRPGRGSLGEVLPESLQALFGEAARGATMVSWAPSSTSRHAIRVCTLAGAGAPDPRVKDASAGHMSERRDFAVLEDNSVPRIAASTQADTGGHETEGPSNDTQSRRLIGLAVHRLLHREGLDPDAPEQRLLQSALDIMRGHSVEEGDLTSLAGEAIARFRALSAHRELRETYLSGQAFHEIPFTLAIDDRTSGHPGTASRIVRGAIDCLVAAPDRITVLEFKTGRPRAGDRAQAELYRLAAEALFPGASVETRLVYTSDTSGMSAS